MLEVKQNFLRHIHNNRISFLCQLSISLFLRETDLRIKATHFLWSLMKLVLLNQFLESFKTKHVSSVSISPTYNRKDSVGEPEIIID